jgi:hypothetical protein
MEDDKIFINRVTLNFFNQEVEKSYQIKLNSCLLKSIRYINIILFLVSTMTSILNYFYRDQIQTVEFVIVEIVSYTNSLINLIFVVVSFSTRKIKILKFSVYLGYIFFLFTCANFNYPFIIFIYNKTFVLMSITIITEILLRLLYGVFYLLSFSEFFLLNLIEIILIWLYIFPTSDPLIKRTTIFNLICYNFLFIYLTLFSYFVDKQLKISFYYRFKYEEKLKWLNVLLDNMNTGILSLEDGKIRYLNKCLEKISESIKAPPESESKFLLK